MITLEGLAKQVERQARALERLVDHLAYASLPAVMKKSRAARELGCSPSTLARLIKDGDIRCNKKGQVPASEILRYAAVEGREKPRANVAKHDAREEAQKFRAWRVP